MTAKDFTRTYEALGLTQSGVAFMLGVDPRTIRYWSTGERKVPEPVARFLLYLSKAGVTPEEVMRALSPSDVRGLLNE